MAASRPSWSRWISARRAGRAAAAEIRRETEAAAQTGPEAAPFGEAPVDILADTTAAAPEPAPEPVDGFPPSDALPEPPPEPDAAAPADAELEAGDDAPDA